MLDGVRPFGERATWSPLGHRISALQKVIKQTTLSGCVEHAPAGGTGGVDGGAAGGRAGGEASGEEDGGIVRLTARYDFHPLLYGSLEKPLAKFQIPVRVFLASLLKFALFKDKRGIFRASANWHGVWNTSDGKAPFLIVQAESERPLSARHAESVFAHFKSYGAWLEAELDR